MKHILQEILLRLLNTGRQEGREVAYENVYRTWRKLCRRQGQFTLYRAKGCEACSNTGYKGRSACMSLLIASDSIRS